MRAFDTDQVLANGITVRQAKNDDGFRIGEIAVQNGFTLEVDWSEVEPSWLVSEHEGRIIGALQYLYGKPVARLEMMVMAEEASPKVRILGMLALYTAGVSIAKMHGVGAISGMIGDDAEVARKMIEEKFGAMSSSRGTIYYYEVA